MSKADAPTAGSPSTGGLALIDRRNYHWVREYLAYLQNIKRLSPQSIDRYWSHLRHLLLWADVTALTHAAQITPPFGEYVAHRTYRCGQREAVPLGTETQKKIIETGRSFFRWAKMYYSKPFLSLPATWVNDLIPPKVADRAGTHVFVTLEEALCLANLSGDRNDLALWRDQAGAAFLFLSGMRARAFTTLPMAAVNFDQLEVYQWPQKFEVMTKGGRTATTILLPIPDLLAQAKSWDAFLRENIPPEVWPTYRWYPPVDNQWGLKALSFAGPGANRPAALNKRLRLLWQRAGLPAKSAHKFRHGHAVFGVERCRSMAEYQAVSRNLMHRSIAITDKIYAGIELEERKQLISMLAHATVEPKDAELYEYLGALSRADLAKAIRMAAELLVR
jgi:site-specific recombinase XerC